MGKDCTVVMQENATVQLAKISNKLGANYLTLLLCACILVFSLYTSYVLITLAASIVRTYYSLLPHAIAPVKKKPKPAKTATAKNDDDVVYPDAAAVAASLASNLQDSDNSRIKASITRLKARYAQYNAAMTDYASRVKGKVADDVIDETILSRENDDFQYNKVTSPSM